MAGKITGGMHGVQNYLRVILSPEGEGVVWFVEVLAKPLVAWASRP
jgi:hypothetical protein